MRMFMYSTPSGQIYLYNKPVEVLAVACGEKEVEVEVDTDLGFIAIETDPRNFSR